MGAIDKGLPVVVLGAGIAGLGAAWRCRELGLPAIVFEARDRVGGLLDNFEINGFRFDHAVHLNFGQDPKARAIFDQTPSLTHAAESRCYDHPHWMRHPVQNNLFPLPIEEKIDLLESFCRRPSQPADDSYDSWLRAQYGDAIAERYPVRYTRKYWATDASQLSTNWIGDRMRRADFREILRGCFTADTSNSYYIQSMRYPLQGGYKAYLQPLLKDADIRLAHAAVHIDSARQRVSFANGAQVDYEYLVSTMPLPEAVRLCPDAPPDVLRSADRLIATHIDLISVGFADSRIKDLWFYIYDEDILASRAYSPSVKSSDNVPPGCSSLQFEIYARDGVPPDVPALFDNTRHALHKLGIASRDDILFMDHRRLNFGNVIHYRGMEADRDAILRWFRSRQVACRGRFGEWAYLWSHQSLMSGYTWPESLLG